MLHQPYPKLELECVTTLVDITRRGALKAEIKTAAKCAYNLGGAGLGIFVGEPEDVIVGDAITLVGAQAVAVEPSIEELEDCRNQLSAAMPDILEGNFGAVGGFGEDATENLDPATLALLMQFAMKMIELFMNRKKRAA